MTLLEMAQEYRANVALVHQRLTLLRRLYRQCEDSDERERLYRRVAALMQVCQEGRAAAYTMETYYLRREEHYEHTQTAKNHSGQ